jgi:phosphatidate cytidylyltransferase
LPVSLFTGNWQLTTGNFLRQLATINWQLTTGNYDMSPALRNRLTFGPLMLAGLFLLLWIDYRVQTKWNVGGVGILILLLLALPLAINELAYLFTAERIRPYKTIAISGSAMIILHAFFTQFKPFEPYGASTLAFTIVFVMLLAALRRAMRMQTEEAIGHMAGTVLATLYYGGLGWFLLALRVKDSPHFHGSTSVVLLILLVVKFTDIGAFFGGKVLGRHKLIPWLSPGKTWEGLICGLFTAAAIGAACAPLVENLGWQKAMVFGFVIGGVGQLGDLLESLMKRDAEVKDSGTLIPGFGGVLDVLDSPLFAAPFAYLLFSLP